MRVLFCTQHPLDPRLGAPQTLLALGAELERMGHDVDYLNPAALHTDEAGFPAALRGHLRHHGATYDVVDYDYRYLPARRDELPTGTLFVARVQLLRAQLVGVRVPPLPRLRSRVGDALYRRRRAATLAAAARADDAAFAAADLVVVLSEGDRACLAARGHDPEKVAVLPNGLAAEAVGPLLAVPEAVPPGPPLVGSVGMFGPRKGAGDFPAFFRRLAEAVPGVRLRLLGTHGMLATAEAVRACFPRRLRERVEVVPRYRPEELAGLLAPCWAGVFPSYNEGFGLGVIEMLAAALPVVAYDASGPTDILPPERLVPRGAPEPLADRLALLLNDPAGLAAARRAARRSAAAYRWPESAARTAASYEAALARLRCLPVPAAGVGVPTQPVPHG